MHSFTEFSQTSTDPHIFLLFSITPAPYNKYWVYLVVKTCEVFLCFVAIVRDRVYYVDFFVFRFTSLVSVTGFYTEDEPKIFIFDFIFITLIAELQRPEGLQSGAP